MMNKVMTTIYNAIVDFIKKVKNETNVYLTKKEYELNDCNRRGKMTLKWWKEQSVLIISEIYLDTPDYRVNNNLLTLSLTKILSRENELLEPDRLVIQTIMLEGVYSTELYKKLTEKGWISEGLSNLKFY